jgi:hypothetical protein
MLLEWRSYVITSDVFVLKGRFVLVAPGPVGMYCALFGFRETEFLFQIAHHLITHRVRFVMKDRDQLSVLIKKELGKIPDDRILKE